MPLESIENQTKVVTTASMNKSPKRTRIISESTGLVKFNITQKINERDNSNKEFERLETKAQNNEELKQLSQSMRNGLKLSSTISPRSPSPVKSTQKTYSPKRENIGMINDQLMLELASKQREVLELKSQMDQLKKKLSTSERELWEIERKCNRSTASTLPPALSPIRSRHPVSKPIPPPQQSKSRNPTENPLRSKPSISTIKASIEATANSQSNNFEKLKKKISMNQLNSKPSLTFKNFQKDSTVFWEKSLNAFTSLKTDFMKEVNINNFNENDKESDYEDDSDISDYGCADISDYQVAVK